MTEWELAFSFYMVMSVWTIAVWAEDMVTDPDFGEAIGKELRAARSEGHPDSIIMITTLGMLMLVIGLCWPYTLTLFYMED